jgi:hypothetical protein
MYTSYIGKKFLRLYNEREKKNLSAEDFFEEVQFPIFFDDAKHLMHVHGSTFFQKVSRKEQQSNTEKESVIRLKRLQTDVSNGKISGSTFVGYAAEKATSVTSGQVSDLKININKEEIYASWMGEALGIGVSGKLVLLIDESEILWTLFCGWKHYRNYLNQTPNVKDKQIEIWNGLWLWHCFRPNFNSVSPLDGIEIRLKNTQGKIAILAQEWVKIIFALSSKFPNKVITAYSYNLDKTNTTLGFINLYLPEVHKLYELKDKIIIDESKTILLDEEISALETFYTFRNACKFGTIGLKAIEPAKLREYMPKGSVLYAQGKEYKFSTEESYIKYKLYKIWIMAMLNKTELLSLASSIAKALLEYEKEGLELEKSTDSIGKKGVAPKERGKTTRHQRSQEVQDSTNIKVFVEKLTEVLGSAPTNAEVFRSTVIEILKMHSDNFPLFITLIRFEYVYWKSKKY